MIKKFIILIISLLMLISLIVSSNSSNSIAQSTPLTENQQKIGNWLINKSGAEVNLNISIEEINSTAINVTIQFLDADKKNEWRTYYNTINKGKDEKDKKLKTEVPIEILKDDTNDLKIDKINIDLENNDIQNFVVNYNPIINDYEFKIGWESVVIESASDVGAYSSIGLDSNGIIHVSHYNSDLRYCNNTGGTWSCTSVDITGDVGAYSSIAVDSNNKIHISYHDLTNTNLKYCNNTASDGTWSCATVGLTTNTHGEYSSIAVDSLNGIHISNYDGDASALAYCNKTISSGWSCSNLDTVGVKGRYSSIAVDSNNRAHISYEDGTSGNLNYCNNTASDYSWSCIAVDTTNDVGLYTSIAVDSNNKIHISHFDITNLNSRYCNNTGGTWSCTSVDTTDNVGKFTSIAVDSNNKIHISHNDSTNNNFRYCNNTASDGTWSCTNLGRTTSIDSYGRALAIKKGVLSTTISFDNFVHFSYHNNTDLYYTNVPLTTINPNVTINQPQNQTYTTNTINFNVTAVDEKGMSTCLYTLNSGINNFTMSNLSTSPTEWTASNSTMSQGSQTVRYYCNDSNNNLNNSQIRTFFIDSINPSISITTPTNNTNTTNTLLDVNFTRSDTNLGSCWYSNDTYSINTSLASCGNLTAITWSEGLHNVTIYANDTLGNENKSSVSFRIDTTSPSIIIINPTNNTNTTNTLLDVNFTRTDSGSGIASCWYSNDTYLVNTTLTSCTNITTVTWSEGLHNVTIYTNDTVGNENKSSVSFRIDTTSPIITITSPVNGSTSSSANVAILYTYIENGSGLDTCKWSQNGGLVNTTLICGTNITQSWANGLYTVIIYAQDLVGNEGRNSVTFTVTVEGGGQVESGGGGSTTTTITQIVGQNVSWGITTDVQGDRFVFDIPPGGSRERNIVFTNLKAQEVDIQIKCEDVNGELCKYVTFINKNENKSLIQENFLTQMTLTDTTNEEKTLSFSLDTPTDIPSGIYDFNIVGVDQEGNRGVVSVRVEVSEDFFSLLIGKFLGRTKLAFLSVISSNLSNFLFPNILLLFLPLVFLSPLFFIVFGKIKVIGPLLSILIPIAVSGIIFIFLDI